MNTISLIDNFLLNQQWNVFGLGWLDNCLSIWLDWRWKQVNYSFQKLWNFIFRKNRFCLAENMINNFIIQIFTNNFHYFTSSLNNLEIQFCIWATKIIWNQLKSLSVKFDILWLRFVIVRDFIDFFHNVTFFNLNF